VSKTDIFWGGAFCSTYCIYLRLAFDYYLNRKETEYDNLIADYYIQIIERDVLNKFLDDKDDVTNLITLIEKKGLNVDMLKKLHSYIDSASKRDSGIIDTIEDCKSKLEKNIQMLE
jgi:hypothetical protein